MRDFIIVTVLCLAALFVADRVWFDGKLLGAIKQDMDFSSSSMRRLP